MKIKIVAALLTCIISPFTCVPGTNETCENRICAVLEAQQADGDAYCADAVIYVERGGEKFTVAPSHDSGYEPSLVLADFTGDGLNDVYYNIQSGGSGAFSYSCIYDFSGPQPEIIFDSDEIENEYTAQYQDGYKVKVTNGERIFYIDISGRSGEYLDGLYSDGKLIRPVAADVSAVNTAAPVYIRSGTFDLSVMRRITGLYNADLLGYVQEFYKYENGEFTVYFSAVCVV